MLELAAGDVVGGYVIERRLGRGGMGAVYAARDPGVDRRVALKVIDPLALGPEGVVRFTREAELAARVDGLGGVVRVHARGVHRGAPFLVMELIEGRDLGALLADAAQPLAPARLAGYVEQVARALQRCHDAGVLHRDLKPANIIVQERDDAPFVADFGLARAVDSERLTLTGELLGTPAYMAPEQALDAARATSPLVDVYALGAILYHGLTGRPPRRGAGALMQLLGEDPPAPASVRKDVDRGLEEICLRAMERDPARRYASAGALADDLVRWRAGERPAAPRRRPTGALALVAVGLAAAALALAPWRSDDADPTPAADAAAVARAIEQLVAAVPTQTVVGVDLDLDALQARLARLARLDDPSSTTERVAALARARATAVGTPPAPAPAPADALARAADAWAWWRGGDVAEALRRLGPTTPETAPLELRLREALPPAALFAWLQERRGTAHDPWPGARPRAVARLATVLRDAATGEAPSPEALGAVDAAVALDPPLLQEALEQAADAWRPLLGDPTRASAAAGALRLLLAGRASASALRPELLRTFDELARAVPRVEFSLQPQYTAALLRWDDHVAALDPGLVPPAEYTERLARSFPARKVFLAGLDYALACLRRGVTGGDGYSLDGLAQILPAADTAALASDTSAAARLCWAAHLLALPDGDLAADRFEPPRLDAIIDALESVLAAPRVDLHPLYAVEVRALLGDARLERAIRRGVAASRDDLARAEAVLEEVWALGPTQDLAWTVANTRDRQLKLQGAAAADRARSQARVIPTLQAVLASGKQEERTRRARRRLAGALWNIGVRWFEADDPTAGLGSMRASFEALAPRTGWYSERDPRPRAFLDRALAQGALDLADDFVREHGDRACAELSFVARAIEHELARGRVERARQLLTLGRELHPDHAWARVERWFEGR